MGQQPPVRKNVGPSIVSPDTPLEHLVDFTQESQFNSPNEEKTPLPLKNKKTEDAKEEIDLHVSSSVLQDATLGLYLANLTWVNFFYFTFRESDVTEKVAAVDK